MPIKHRICALFFIIIFLLWFTPTSMAATGTDTMLRYWKFDETTGNASDSSGDSSTITNNNSTYSAGRINNAATFNGTNANFSGTGPDLANSSFTISAWIYANNLTADQVWFDLGSASATDKALHLRLTTGGALKMGFFLDDLQTSNGIINAGAWYQVVYTYNSSTRARAIYVNGTSRASNTAGANFSGDTVMTIGSWGNFERWNGKIDDVRIYNRVLTASEIADLAAGNHTAATWTGDTSTDTENAGNWDINALPDPYTRIIIADVTNQPLATANMNIAGLTINTNAFFHLGTYNLTMNDSGTFNNNGTLALANSQTLTNFSNDTDSGTILIHPTTNISGLKTGSTYNHLVINDSLVGYWKFDELSTGSIVSDSSGFVNDGTLTGSSGPNNKPQPSTSVPTVNFFNRRSLQFDGTDDLIYMNSYVGMPQSTMSICTWIKTTASSEQFIIEGNRNPSLFNTQWILEMSSNGKLLFWDYDSYSIYGFDQSTLSNHAINDGTWHHICFVKNGTSGTYYLDGASDGTKTAAVDISYWSATLAIGGDYRDGNRYLNGNLDDLRIYNRALSSDEIARLAHGEIPSTSYTTTQINDLNINGNFILNSGTLESSLPGVINMYLRGNFENNGGVFSPSNGTVTLNGSNQMITSSNNFYNLTKTVTAADTLSFGQNSTTTITGTLNLTGMAGNLLALRSAQSGIAFKINPQGTRTLSYLNPQDSNNINASPIAYDQNSLYGSNLTNWITSGNPSSTTNNTSSSTSSVSAPTSCDNTPPGRAPDLFEVKMFPSAATIYFVPVTPSTGYVISYGLTPDANQYAVSFKYSDTSGAIPYTINSLNTNTKYYFKVRGMNGCKPGGWSAVKFGDTKSVIKISPQPVPTKTSAVKGARTVLPSNKVSTKKDTKVKTGIKKKIK